MITVDARNHGDSPHSSEMSYLEMAKDVIQLLESLKIEKSVLIGHSMGGGTMMCTALNYPQKVDKLVVVDMSPVVKLRNTPGLIEMNTVFEAMLSTKIKNGSSLSETRKVIDRQLAKLIRSDTLRQVRLILMFYAFLSSITMDLEKKALRI